jgi:hypothetical protein
MSEDLLAGPKKAIENRRLIVTDTDGNNDIFIIDAYKRQVITSSFFYALLKPYIKPGDSSDDIIDNRTIIIELSPGSMDEYSRAVRRLCTELFQREKFNIPLEKISFAQRVRRVFGWR